LPSAQGEAVGGVVSHARQFIERFAAFRQVSFQEHFDGMVK
jgi:hypothetical protein